MTIISDPEWARCQERYTAWWNHDIADRPLFRVVVSAKGEPSTADVQTMWLDPEFRLNRFAWHLEHDYYGADSVPVFSTMLGPGSLAIHLGCRPNFTPRTVWYEPTMTDLATAEVPAYDPQEHYWVWSRELAREARRRFGERALVAFPEPHENLDILASLRGTQEILTDLVDHPKDVHRLQRGILAARLSYTDDFYSIVKDELGGSVPNYFRTWGPGRVSKLQCDLSGMISPRMFEEFVVPYLRAQCQAMDFSGYHLDGPGAIVHLDLLLSIPELDAIQWVPGDGQPDLGDPCWFPLCRRILAGGKSLLLLRVPPEAVRTVYEALGVKGVCVTTYVDTREEAEALESMVAGLGRR